MISRCSSPMPWIRVWLVSGSTLTLNVGSSIARRARDCPSFSSSTLVLGSMATAMTGVGKSIASSTTGLAGSHRVSPVRVSFSPTTAAISPAEMESISSRLLACMRSRRPIRSFFSRVEL